MSARFRLNLDNQEKHFSKISSLFWAGFGDFLSILGARYPFGVFGLFFSLGLRAINLKSSEGRMVGIRCRMRSDGMIPTISVHAITLLVKGRAKWGMANAERYQRLKSRQGGLQTGARLGPAVRQSGLGERHAAHWERGHLARVPIPYCPLPIASCSSSHKSPARKLAEPDRVLTCLAHSTMRR